MKEEGAVEHIIHAVCHDDLQMVGLPGYHGMERLQLQGQTIHGMVRLIGVGDIAIAEFEGAFGDLAMQAVGIEDDAEVAVIDAVDPNRDVGAIDDLLGGQIDGIIGKVPWMPGPWRKIPMTSTHGVQL